MNIIVFGAPACGKDTMCNLIKEKFDMHIISTGDIIRENILIGTEFGQMLKQKTDKGDFVSDSVVNKMVKEKIQTLNTNDNLLFTGFPRTLDQAKWLCSEVNITHAVELVADYKVILQRVLKRKICTSCNAVYGNENASQTKCAKCGGDLIVRTDDNEETLKNRLQNYQTKTAPLTNYFSLKGIHYLVDASQSIDNVFCSVKKILGENDDL